MLKYSAHSRNLTLAFAVVLALATVVRCCIAASLPLGDDEAFYWVWSRHPAACYFDHPGMVAWLVGGSVKLFGDNSFAIRFPTVLLGALSAAIMFYLGQRLFNKVAGFWAGILFIITPVFALGSFLVASDAPMGVFWLLYVWCVAEATIFNKHALWYPAGLFLGLALLSKYVSILLAISTVFYLLSSRGGRQAFKRPGVYIAAGISAIVFFPVFKWNMDNHWASFLFNLEGRHGGGSFHPGWFLELLGLQLAFISPLLLAGLFVALLRGARLRKGNPRFRLLFWFSTVTLGLFWLGSFVARMKPHWPAPGYLSLIITLSALWAGVGGRKAQPKWIGTCIGLAFVFTSLLYGQAFHRILPLGAKDDNTNDLYGWDVLTPVVKRQLASLEEQSARRAYLFADRYQIAAQLAWNLKMPYRSFSIDPGKDQFDFWIKPKELIGSDGVFIWDENRKLKDGVLDCFASVKEVAKVPVFRQGERVRVFHVLICRNLNRIPQQALN